jgi:8-oxo-dGTP pyrophosphatase MutT (NUDIX family)
MYSFLLKCASLYSEAAIYWGRKASGLLIFCRDDGTILLLKRSQRVENPGTWGIPGGAVGGGFHGSDEHDEKDPENDVFIGSAFKETEEELGVVPKDTKYFGETAFRDGNFTYKTFVYGVPLKEKKRISNSIQLNWENTEWKWFKLNELPANLHTGIVFSLKDLAKRKFKWRK